MGKTIKDILAKPSLLFMTFGYRGLFNWMSDERYIKIAYKIATEKKLNLDDPRTFNEKLQWLKLHDRRPEYTTMVDKYEVKKYVADKIGEEYIIPTLGVWHHFDDIDFNLLPDQFVLKCTHDSGSVVLCTDKNVLDKKGAKKKLEKCLSHNYFWAGREWPYKNVKPMIIAEPYLIDESGLELKDYKIFNFNGEPKLIEVDFNRFTEHKRNLYSTKWDFIDAEIKYPNDSNNIIDKPFTLQTMLDLAKKMSAGYPFIRTDFYCINEKTYFGELTLYHGGGCEKFTPESFEMEMGDWLQLNQ